MWTITRSCLKRASGYQNRVMVYAHRRQRARYLPPKTPYVRSPLANKDPEQYYDTWNPHSGIEWYNRLRHRGAYRHWPWARWSDDPIRFHEDPTCRRTLSAALDEGYPSTGGDGREGKAPHVAASVNEPAHANACVPLWDYYAQVGQAYHGITAHSPLEALAEVIHPYVRQVWPRSVVHYFLSSISQNRELRVKTIGDVLARKRALEDWVAKGGKISNTANSFLLDSKGGALLNAVSNQGIAKVFEFVPKGFIQHIILSSRDVVLYHQKLEYRKQEHNDRGVLRTREMERYYALPHPTLKFLSASSTLMSSETKEFSKNAKKEASEESSIVKGINLPPPMPVKLAQPSGKYPWGKYTYLGKGIEQDDSVSLDPLHMPDAWYKSNQYPG